MRYPFMILSCGILSIGTGLNSAIADEGHRHGPFMTNQSDLPTHGAEKSDVQSGDNLIDIYGKFWLLLEYNNPGPSGRKNATLTSDKSRLGFRGNKSIATDYKLFWQVESFIDLDNISVEGEEHPGNGSELAGADSFIGVNGPFGSVMGGKHMTPYRSTAHNWDVFSHRPGDSSIVLGRLPHIKNPYDHHGNVMPMRLPNTLLYATNYREGFNAMVSYNFLNEKPQDVKTGNPGAYSLNLSYGKGPLSVFFAHEGHRNLDVYQVGHDPGPLDVVIDRLNGTLLGGMYHFPNLMITLIAEQLKVKDNNPAILGDKRTAVHASTELTLGQWRLRLAGGQAGDFVESTGGGYFALGGAYKFNQEVEVFTVFTRFANDKEASYGTFHVDPAVEGEDPSTLAVGVSYIFR